MNVLENQDFKLWIHEGILFSIFKSSEITLNTAQKCVDERVVFCKGKTYPMLVDFTNLRSANKEAREYLSSGKSQELLSAGAFLVKKPLAKHIINFWLKINKPILPARFFTDEQKAIDWLEKYK